jgi:hypothetical protein
VRVAWTRRSLLTLGVTDTSSLPPRGSGEAEGRHFKFHGTGDNLSVSESAKSYPWKPEESRFSHGFENAKIMIASAAP